MATSSTLYLHAKAAVLRHESEHDASTEPKKDGAAASMPAALAVSHRVIRRLGTEGMAYGRGITYRDQQHTPFEWRGNAVENCNLS